MFWFLSKILRVSVTYSLVDRIQRPIKIEYKEKEVDTVCKVPKCGVFSSPYFPVFRLNTEIYTKIFLKTNISYSLILTHMRAYQRVWNVIFEENFGLSLRTQFKYGKIWTKKYVLNSMLLLKYNHLFYIFRRIKLIGALLWILFRTLGLKLKSSW